MNYLKNKQVKEKNSGENLYYSTLDSEAKPSTNTNEPILLISGNMHRRLPRTERLLTEKKKTIPVWRTSKTIKTFLENK